MDQHADQILEAQREPVATPQVRQPAADNRPARAVASSPAEDVRSTFDGHRASGPGEEFAALMDNAREGSPEAMVQLGLALRDGLGAPQDFTAARARFEQAARLGHPAGMREYADCLLAARGGSGDPVEGFAWLLAAHAAEPMASVQARLLELASGFSRDAIKRARKRGEALSRYYARARKRADV
ncbi:MAG: hypothetical protein K2P95_02670 [Hyphomonadaceae bacterium]|nr:hypothetical protein [Hyphomonadaceae bacterium]